MLKGPDRPLARQWTLKPRKFNLKAQVSSVTLWRPPVPLPPTRDELLEGGRFGETARTRGGFTTPGQSHSVSTGMVGSRLTTIGDDAIADTTLLKAANKGSSQQSFLFKDKLDTSGARRGRQPIGYGTAYKIF